jgi:hypothetical protein
MAVEHAGRALLTIRGGAKISKRCSLMDLKLCTAASWRSSSRANHPCAVPCREKAHRILACCSAGVLHIVVLTCASHAALEAAKPPLFATSCHRCCCWRCRCP